ncbi:MAG: glycosyltransferase [Oscillospiraceae bacterium]|jgi:glycosyltransferase involved in cell wall biosynthesis
MERIFTVIPALEPDERLPKLVRELVSIGFEDIVVVDDGSGPDYKEIFSEAEAEGAAVIQHEKNLGKGAAIKTAIRTIRYRCGGSFGIITADSDGQHAPGDILRVKEAMIKKPSSLIIGARNFSNENVPARNRFGNRTTSLIFHMMTGVRCSDTQTGLRGIPPCLIDLATMEKGSRYEYEMNFLLDAADFVTFVEVPIETIYIDGNKHSHYRVIADSARVYGRILRYAASSLSGTAVDLSMFALFTYLLPRTGMAPIYAVFWAGIFARLLAGAVNFLLNKYWTFSSRDKAGPESLKYLALFLFQMGVSSLTTSLISRGTGPVVLIKIGVDLVMSIFSFLAQQRWVFKKNTIRKKALKTKALAAKEAQRASL